MVNPSAAFRRPAPIPANPRPVAPGHPDNTEAPSLPRTARQVPMTAQGPHRVHELTNRVSHIHGSHHKDYAGVAHLDGSLNMIRHIDKPEVIAILTRLFGGLTLGMAIANWISPPAPGSEESNWMTLLFGATVGYVLAAYVLHAAEKIIEEIQEEQELRENNENGLLASQLVDRVIERANAQPLNIEGISRCLCRLASLVRERPQDNELAHLPREIARLGEGALALPGSDTLLSRWSYQRDLNTLTDAIHLLHENQGVSKAVCLEALRSLKGHILARAGNLHPAISTFLAKSLDAEIAKLQALRSRAAQAATPSRFQ